MSSVNLIEPWCPWVNSSFTANGTRATGHRASRLGYAVGGPVIGVGAVLVAVVTIFTFNNHSTASLSITRLINRVISQ